MSASLVGSEMCIRDRSEPMAWKSAMSAMYASPMPALPSGPSNCSPTASKSNAAIPRSILSCTCRGTRLPSLAR
eukprot:12338290-Alexandrium_andersonii.AAC.1